MEKTNRKDRSGKNKKTSVDISKVAVQKQRNQSDGIIKLYDFGLNEKLLNNLKKLNTSDIQTDVIIKALEGSNLFVLTAEESFITYLLFVILYLAKIDKIEGPHVLIIVPNKTKASQANEYFSALTDGC
jgi:superfamily II DNA/RNA helicase